MSASTPHQPIPLLMNARETAKAMAICERKLWELTKRGEIPHIRIGRSAPVTESVPDYRPLGSTTVHHSPREQRQPGRRGLTQVATGSK